ncbi:MAG: indole-3-glycerol phosphate synthase TrpC, partial [Ostreibacterium sp.]
MSNIPSILQDIIAEKQREVAKNSQIMPVALIENMIAEAAVEVPRGFYLALREKIQLGQNGVIAEIKKASPSKGLLREDFQPADIARSYENHGAACLSVLTDEKFFQGSELYLDMVKNESALPVIRKDFIISEYQVFESRAMGADCILLIAGCLSHEEMLTFTRLAYELGMDVLVEVHNLTELDKIAGLPIRMVGINNRNLHTFEVDLSVTVELSSHFPE